MAHLISFSLEENDIAYFKNVLLSNYSKKPKIAENEILAQTKKRITELQCSEIAGMDTPFIENKLKKLSAFVAMLEEPNWVLTKEERNSILQALTYFNATDDLIPDDIPSLGFLDDAIMIELVAESLTSSVDAFNQFCIYRDSEQTRSKDKTITKESWLADKRHEKHERMRIRHSRDHSRSGSFHSVF